MDSRERDELRDLFQHNYNDATTLFAAVQDANADAAFASLFESICARARELQSETASLGDNIADAIMVNEPSSWRRNIKFISECFDRCIERAAENREYGRKHATVARHAMNVLEELSDEALALWQQWAQRPLTS